jgi:hypothetical protein
LCQKRLGVIVVKTWLSLLSGRKRKGKVKTKARKRRIESAWERRKAKHP